MQTRAIDHVDIADVITFTSYQGRQKSMQPVEIRQLQKDVAVKGLQPAAGVARAVLEHEAANRIGDARLQPFEARGLAAHPLAGDETDRWGAAAKRLQQRWDECRLVLAVAIDGDDDRGAGSRDPGTHGRGLA